MGLRRRARWSVDLKLPAQDPDVAPARPFAFAVSPFVSTSACLCVTDRTSPGHPTGRNVAVLVGGADIPPRPLRTHRDPADPCKLGDVMIPRLKFGRLALGERVANPAPLSMQIKQ